MTPNEQSPGMKLTETTPEFRLELTRKCLFRIRLENIVIIEGQSRDFLINPGMLRIPGSCKAPRKTLSTIRKSQEIVHTFSNLFIVIIKLVRLQSHKALVAHVLLVINALVVFEYSSMFHAAQLKVLYEQ